MPKTTQVKEAQELPCMGQTAVLKEKKKVKEKPLQENTISRSSLRHEVAEGKDLSSSWQNGIQVAAPVLLLKPSRGGDDGVAAFLSGEPGASELAVGVTDLRETVEKELDPQVPVQKGDTRDLKRKKETEEKQEPRKQRENFLQKEGSKKCRLEENLVNVMEDIREDGADGDRDCGVRQGKVKQGSGSTWGRADEREKQEKGRGEKRKKVKMEGEEKQGKKKMKEKKMEGKQELERLGEELGVGEVGKESEDAKGLKEEEEVDEQEEKGWEQIQSMKTEENEGGKGDVLGKKQKNKEKKPNEKKKEKGTKDKEKSKEEETPKKTQKRKSKDEGEENNKKKVKKEEKKKEKKEEAQNKWKWWEEEKTNDGVKWKQLEHKGPYFVPLYEPLPDDVQFYYDGKPLKLSLATEEIATFYAKMLDHEYTTKEIFQNNFFNDWRKEMTPQEQEIIKQLDKCDFREIHKYFVDKNEARKALSKEEKQKLKEEADKIQEEYGYCILDGHREKIGNFKTEPPGLFRGRGDHPKMGMLKKRIMPEDVIINCSK
ncbi:hypothetical protein ASZ78_001519 [Callipepla squamata]|uniref:DNA topoisomerase I DNA binding eukaryotic-type domain-containing protein n=1 Tax=Callipepla squamata TaxID=9009 RepID=A0A226N083_CALSU|nr:hypothetical protein ASZ78_001519 [Callipepla squamata]